MRSVIRQVDKDQPLATIASMETFIDAAIAEPRFQARLLAVFASVALSLAIVGIYGVLSYLVSQRIHEIGIRLALGAQRVELFRMLLRDAQLRARHELERSGAPPKGNKAVYSGWYSSWDYIYL